MTAHQGLQALSSDSNPRFRQWKSLLTSSGLKEHGLFILSGEKLVREMCAHPVLNIQAEIVPMGERRVSHAQNAFQLPRGLFRELDVLGTDFNLLVLEQREVATWTPNLVETGLELWCPLGDPGNLGAVLRSALGLGANRVVLTAEAAHPFLPKAVKAAAGATWNIPIFRGPSLQKLSSISGDWIALDSAGQDLSAFSWPASARLLIGEEGQGLPEDFQPTTKLSIPTQNIESLNATVAASIALFSYHQAHGTKPIVRVP